jgi:signal peptidase II
MHTICKKIGLALIVILLIALDQSSKYWIVHHLQRYQSWPLLPWLNITHTINHGIAFSFFAHSTPWVQSSITLLNTMIIFYLAYTIIFTHAPIRFMRSYGLLFSGAVGNLIDRLTHGYVIDFIDFHWHQWHFATFNLADSMICIAVFYLIVLYQLHPPTTAQKAH